ncbi:hypothetical protein [Roseiterribacter gracilis]|uniref:Uncharacterized protein n=1 Tax=Roseiterribacter gracilis TaxID=2812848 RepID=A0A8S8XGS4_9PROT|nr:hypothetical protein TMPK1_29140 [Rhodospirillales bacterium TMPK1]
MIDASALHFLKSVAGDSASEVLRRRHEDVAAARRVVELANGYGAIDHIRQAQQRAREMYDHIAQPASDAARRIHEVHASVDSVSTRLASLSAQDGLSASERYNRSFGLSAVDRLMEQQRQVERAIYGGLQPWHFDMYAGQAETQRHMTSWIGGCSFRGDWWAELAARSGNNAGSVLGDVGAAFSEYAATRNALAHDHDGRMRAAALALEKVRPPPDVYADLLGSGRVPQKSLFAIGHEFAHFALDRQLASLSARAPETLTLRDRARLIELRLLRAVTRAFEEQLRSIAKGAFSTAAFAYSVTQRVRRVWRAIVRFIGVRFEDRLPTLFSMIRSFALRTGNPPPVDRKLAASAAEVLRTDSVEVSNVRFFARPTWPQIRARHRGRTRAGHAGRGAFAAVRSPLRVEGRIVPFAGSRAAPLRRAYRPADVHYVHVG